MTGWKFPLKTLRDTKKLVYSYVINHPLKFSQPFVFLSIFIWHLTNRNLQKIRSLYFSDNYADHLHFVTFNSLCMFLNTIFVMTKYRKYIRKKWIFYQCMTNKNIWCKMEVANESKSCFVIRLFVSQIYSYIEWQGAQFLTIAFFNLCQIQLDTWVYL